jgi:autotransporter passenger strand-loop-strand repeat protein
MGRHRPTNKTSHPIDVEGSRLNSVCARYRLPPSDADSDAPMQGSASMTNVSSADLARFSQELARGDRAGFYLDYYNVTGSNEALIQAQISSYSGAIGRTARIANDLDSALPDYPSGGVDSFSLQIAQSEYAAIAADVASGGEGVLSDATMVAIAKNTWVSLGVGNLFPGNFLYLITGDSSHFNSSEGDYLGAYVGFVSGGLGVVLQAFSNDATYIYGAFAPPTVPPGDTEETSTDGKAYWLVNSSGNVVYGSVQTTTFFPVPNISATQTSSGIQVSETNSDGTTQSLSINTIANAVSLVQTALNGLLVNTISAVSGAITSDLVEHAGRLIATIYPSDTSNAPDTWSTSGGLLTDDLTPIVSGSNPSDDRDLVVNSDGTLSYQLGGVTEFTVPSGGSAVLQQDGTFNVTLPSSPVTLQIDGTPTDVGIISNFVSGDIIDFADIGTAISATLDPGNVLTVIGGTDGPVTVNLDPNVSYSGQTFSVTSDGNGGTDVGLVSIAPATVASTAESSGSTFTAQSSPAAAANASEIAWTATAQASFGSPSEDWTGESGPMQSLTSSPGVFAGTALAALDAPTNYSMVQIGAPAYLGPGTFSYDNVGATEDIDYSFASPVPAGYSFILWRPGEASAWVTNFFGAIIASNNGPFTFNVSASLNGAAVSTAAWSMSLATTSFQSALATYSIDPATGVITANGWPVGDSSPSEPSIAAIVITTTTPIDNLEITANTIAYNTWGLAVPTSIPLQVSGQQTVNGTDTDTVIVSGGVQNVDSGGTANGIPVFSGGMQIVNGGVANGATVFSGGTQIVESGGAASGTTVVSYGSEVVSSGGTASFTTLSNGGEANLSGGTAVSATVDDLSYDVVTAGGTAIGTTVNPGGEEYVDAGGIASGATVSGGGENVYGGTAIGATINDLGFEDVIYGGTATGTTVNGGGEEDVFSASTATDTIVNGGGERVYAYGRVSGTTVNSGGAEVISALGTASESMIDAGGHEYVDFGGTATSTTVFSGGVAEVLSGGKANSTVVSGGGVETLSSGGMASGTIIDSGGGEVISSGGTDSFAVVSNGGVEVVFSGGAANGTTVSGGGALVVLPGGTVSGTTGGIVSTGVLVIQSGPGVPFYASSVSDIVVTTGGSEYILADGTAIDSTVYGYGTEEFTFSGGDFIYAGGTAISTTVEHGGYEFVLSGGTASSTIVNGGGKEFVSSGGVASGATVMGTEVVSSGGRTVSNAVSNGGGEYVEFGGVASDTTISVFGTGLNGGTAIGTTVSNGGTEEVVYRGMASGTVVSSGGEEEVANGGFATGTVLISGGMEVLSSGGTASGTVMNIGGSIDLPDLVFISGGSIPAPQNDILTINEGSSSYQLYLSGTYTGETFQISEDVSGGTLITAQCYRYGTRILTEEGEVAVENLHEGDRVVTGSGEVVPITWIGRRHVDCTRHPKPEQVWPVRVSAGEFGHHLPHRDLWLSPDHAVYVRGVLIPIKHLINGTTIAQVPMDEVTYYHVELPQHDVLLAEGMPAESFLDTGGRSNFENGEVMRLFPDFSTPALEMLWETKGCAPLVIHGPELEVARAFVNAQASTRAPAAVAA